jgi:hypothetical protein
MTAKAQPGTGTAYRIEVTPIPMDAPVSTYIRPEEDEYEDTTFVLVTSSTLTEPELAMKVHKLMNCYISFSKEDWDAYEQLKQNLQAHQEASKAELWNAKANRAYCNGWTHALIVVLAGYLVLSVLGLA